MKVTEAVATRRSVRAFLDQPVDREVLTRVLGNAQRAASGGNVQPWNATVLTGEPMQALFARIAQEFPKGRTPSRPNTISIRLNLTEHTRRAALAWARRCMPRSASRARTRPSD